MSSSENPVSSAPSPYAFAPWAEQQGGRTITVYVAHTKKSVFIRGKNIVCTTLDEEGEKEKTEEKEEHVVPLGQVRRVVVVGRQKLDAEFLYTCMRKGIAVDFLDRFNRAVGLSISLDSDVPDLRRHQYLPHNPSDDLALARKIISAKIGNCWSVVRRRVSLTAQCHTLKRQALDAEDAAQLRGIEGFSARLYFGYIKELTPDWGFSERKARPAPDPVNMMLSFGYSMLHNRLASALYSCGLDAKAGFFHQGRGSHCALASDLMEDLRFAVDKLVLRLLGLKQLHPHDFTLLEGRCRFANPAAFKLFVTSFEEAMGKYFTAPCDRPGIRKGSRVTLNIWLDASALAYGRWLTHHATYDALEVA